MAECDALRAERDDLAVRLGRAELENRRQRAEIDRLKASLEEALRAAKRQGVVPKLTLRPDAFAALAWA
jgi:hypothetical protein